MNAEIGDKSIGYKKVIHFGPFSLDAAERSLTKNGEPVPLLGKAFDLLLLLAESGGHLKTHDELYQALWPDTIVVENSLSWYVSALRKALKGKEKGQRYIETVHKYGYRFTVPVRIERVAIEPIEEEDVGATSVAIGPSRGEIAAEADPTEETGAKPESEDVGAVAPTAIAAEAAAPTGNAGGAGESEAAPTGRRTTLFALAGGAVAVVAAVLIWYFAFYRPAATAPPTPVIAVLPFQDLSAKGNDAWFATGIQDTILSKLAEIGKLRVISRTSSEQYQSRPVNLRKVAVELGATVILEGSVQKVGDRVLINAQLIDARTDMHLWAHVYDRSLAHVFEAETDVANQVAAALQAKLLAGETARLTEAPTQDHQAYLLYLKANYYANRIMDNNNVEDLGKAAAQATDLYHQAVTHDPGFALAWARLSRLESYLYWFRFDYAKRSIAKAEHAVRRALALNPALPQAWVALGYVEYYGHRNYTAALAQFERARQSLPNNADVVAAIAYIHRRQGKWREALAGLRQATRLDPRNPRRRTAIGITLMTLRRYPRAESQFELALALAQRDYFARALKLITLLLEGKPPEQIQQTLAKNPGTDKSRGLMLALQAWTARLAHRPADVLAALADAPDWLSAANALGAEPTSLIRAQAWALQGDNARAQQAYHKARELLRNALQGQPKDANLWSLLGLAEAGLGNKREAIADGRKATALVPVSKDATYGASHLLTLARIYVQVSEPGQAIGLLKRLLAMPAGQFISVPVLKRDPIWDPIRKDPHFQALLGEYASKLPVPDLDVPGLLSSVSR